GISQLIHYPSHSVVNSCFCILLDIVSQVYFDSDEVHACIGGYSVFYARNTIPSTPKAVNDIHKRGGTILGTSRGGHDKSQIVDSIQDLQVCIIGGDGTRKGFSVIFDVFLLRMQARGSFAINFEAFNTLSAELF
ncbi:hypothetical protein NC652_002067, partial [Populus alba x Populus x berolinensis]